tara:strand:+ start:181 stop:546 length:366 start_codon:yes stop_codon:yes gene_type:complete
MKKTDKYEGHTPAPWTIDVHTIGKDREITAIVIESNMTTHSNCVLAEVEVENKYAEADARLIADAPLLLAEVKRLREELNYAKVTIDDWDKSGPCVTVYHEGCEYVGMLRLYKDENGKVIE